MTLATTPAVAFGEGRRPEAATRVTLPAFDGPLALLLALIEARQLDVLTVPLGALADAYLDALATLDDDRMGNVSAFVAIASQLILIKSRALLPRRSARGAVGAGRRGARPRGRAARAPHPVPRVPRCRRPAPRRGAARASACSIASPAIARAAGVTGARPPAAEPLSPRLLLDALDGLARIVPPPAPPPETIPRTVTLAERAAIIRAALHGAPVVVLQDLLRGVRDRVVVAVTFLALLELVKRREVVVEQAEPWGPIVARMRPPPSERPAEPRRSTRRYRWTRRWSRSRDCARPGDVDGCGRARPADADERADRGAARGAAVRRREATVARRDRGAGRRRARDGRRAPGQLLPVSRRCKPLR